MKTILIALLVCGSAWGQNINWTQIKSGDRHGANAKGQSSDGTGTSGNLPTYNSGGGLTNGPAPSVTVNGTSCSLGSTCSPAGAGGITSLTGDATASGPGASAATVVKVNGVAYGTSPSTNTVPVVTGSNTVTYETVPNAALANSAVTVNGTTCTLGSTCTPSGAGGITALTGDVTASGPGSSAATVVKVNGIAYSATAAAHTVQVTTTANTTATAKVVPDCTDTAGNHLNYTQSSDAFSCGTSAPAGSAVPLTTGTSVTLSGNNQYFSCTGTCTITVPVPAAGVQYCVFNDDNVATVITLSAIGSSAQYETTARTSYGTAGTGTAVSGGAVGDKICIVGRDSTHYFTLSSTGTWTVN